MPTEFSLYNASDDDLYRKKSREEREAMLYDMVQSALKIGNKPTARKFYTYPGTVRKWVRKYQEGGKEALKLKK